MKKNYTKNKTDINTNNKQKRNNKANTTITPKHNNTE